MVHVDELFFLKLSLLAKSIGHSTLESLWDRRRDSSGASEKMTEELKISWNSFSEQMKMQELSRVHRLDNGAYLGDSFRIQRPPSAYHASTCCLTWRWRGPSLLSNNCYLPVLSDQEEHLLTFSCIHYYLTFNWFI